MCGVSFELDWWKTLIWCHLIHLVPYCCPPTKIHIVTPLVLIIRLEVIGFVFLVLINLDFCFSTSLSVTATLWKSCPRYLTNSSSSLFYLVYSYEWGSKCWHYSLCPNVSPLFVLKSFQTSQYLSIRADMTCPTGWRPLEKPWLTLDPEKLKSVWDNKCLFFCECNMSWF